MYVCKTMKKVNHMKPLLRQEAWWDQLDGYISRIIISAHKEAERRQVELRATWPTLDLILSSVPPFPDNFLSTLNDFSWRTIDEAVEKRKGGKRREKRRNETRSRPAGRVPAWEWARGSAHEVPRRRSATSIASELIITRKKKGERERDEFLETYSGL